MSTSTFRASVTEVASRPVQAQPEPDEEHTIATEVLSGRGTE
jgi:hypothetical protein